MARRRRNTYARRRTQRVQNAQTTNPSRVGGRQDQGRDLRTQELTSNPLLRSVSDYQRAREWSRLWYTDWAARKIVDIPVQDMLRRGWKWAGLDDDQSNMLDKRLRTMNFNLSLRQALRQERLVGGSVLLMGVASQNDDPAEPLILDNIKPGDFAFINMIPRTQIHRLQYGLDPLKPDFGQPSTYHVWENDVHKSRLLVFDGNPLTSNAFGDYSFIHRAQDGFGTSVLAPIYDDLMRAIATRQAAMHLIQRSAVLLINDATIKLHQSTTGGQQALQQLYELADQLSNFNAAIIDGDQVKLDQWSASFGSVPDLMEKFVQFIAAGADIPATRFLGQSPGGLNATGDSDLENYYNHIDELRENHLKPKLEQLLQVLIRSELPNVDPESVGIEFEPLWNDSAKEQAETHKLKAETLTILARDGVIGYNQAEAEAMEAGLIVVKGVPDDPPIELEPELKPNATPKDSNNANGDQ